ncbi:dual serine/threonine and tyrosine protein kinase-like [Chrysoperla carnea]|uniref:dual serine/threonine and tyrosine protein kinase-like n=1 Tax=Chrysoperla carnea TaxID=189513 RepID=UPI001D065D51|nr:dual serine/threonine and tyrosine protein kinase-like [Chrysoperla carnea]
MFNKVTVEFRKFGRNCYYLRQVLTETQRLLEEISLSSLFPDENIKDAFLNKDLLISLRKVLDSNPSILILGQNCNAKALLVNYILGQVILPSNGSNWRWVRIVYGRTKRVRLTIGSEFEIVENLESHEQAWMVVPEVDLCRSDGDCPDLSTVLEVEIPHQALRDKVQIVIPPDLDDSDDIPRMLVKGLDTLPVILYSVTSDILTDDNILELMKYREVYEDLPILFIRISGNTVKSHSAAELTESKQHELQQTSLHTTNPSNISSIYQNQNQNQIDYRLQGLWRQLASLGLLNETFCHSHSVDKLDVRKPCINQYANSMLITCTQAPDILNTYIKECLQFHIIQASATLSKLHNGCLRKFILYAFDMAREIQITPRRLIYAQKKETELYQSLITLANEKHEEIVGIIQNAIQTLRAEIGEDLDQYYSNLSAQNTQQTVKVMTDEIQQLVLRKLSESVASKLVKSVNCLQESFIGTLQRCLENLEKSWREQEENLSASDAIKQFMNAAYNVDLKSSTSFSFVNTFFERVRKIFHGFSLPWHNNSQIHLNSQWRKHVAYEVIDSLKAVRLARTISNQFKERVEASHDLFQSAMRSLENHYSGKLEQTEEHRVAIRKYHAPRFARLALESTSMCDMVRWGMPVQGKEIGRGQFGVVFACEPWGGVDPCAIKSVVPPDERHWNDLAMEFYYTRSIPDHSRIVRLRGSIIDYSYGAGCSPAVLLLMERMTRDLYCALKSGLEWKVRLQIAIDVVEGIRYLHSQGLVHRDIKLKNVLLDCDNRAKLTDLGFCIPEAMMSGSIVGTPVHMAPELLSGHYDSSVDVYAFGILFWYICAGHVRLPYVFEQFQNKEQLWNSVRKGIRPEYLQYFHESCWRLMEQCWAADPAQRPLFGLVQPQLEEIMRTTCV